MIKNLEKDKKYSEKISSILNMYYINYYVNINILAKEAILIFLKLLIENHFMMKYAKNYLTN